MPTIRDETDSKLVKEVRQYKKRQMKQGIRQALDRDITDVMTEVIIVEKLEHTV